MDIPRVFDFFNLVGMPYEDLFRRRTTPIWEIITRLPDYVRELFDFQEVSPISETERVRLHKDWVWVGKRVAIGRDTQVYPFAYISDDVVIGRNCVIGQGAVLKGPLILCDNCVVGPHREVGKSFFFPGAKAAHHNFVGESLIGWGVNLGAMSKTTNLKLDQSEISIWIDEEKVPTGLNRLGAVLGDGTSVGGGVSLNPGALLGKYCRVGPNVAVPNRYYHGGTLFKSPLSEIKPLTS